MLEKPMTILITVVSGVGMQTSRQEAQSRTVVIRKRDHPQGHGVEGHPPDESSP